MNNNEGASGAASNIPNSNMAESASEPKTEQVTQSVAESSPHPVMEEDIQSSETQTVEQDNTAENPSTDIEQKMNAELNKGSNPNIHPIEFKDTIASKHQAAANGPINMLNANGIVSGAKLVSNVWRSFAVAFLLVSIALAVAVVFSTMKISELSEEQSELTKTNSSLSSNLNALYSKLGASNQEEASFVASFGDAISGEEFKTLREALVAQFGEYTIDFDQTDFNSVLRVDNYRVVKLVINNKKYVAYTKSDNVWSILEYDESLHDRCEGFSEEAQLVVDKILSCKDN